MKSILKRSSSEIDSARIVDVKVLSLKEAGLESVSQPPPPPYLNYPPYMYPYPHVQMPVLPPPVTKPKVNKVTETKKEIEKDELLVASTADCIQRESESCYRTAVVEENWEEKHKLLLDEFIRQEQESKFNLAGQEEQILQ